MCPACYCRKSSDEGDKGAADKSVVRQLARAQEYAEKKGWTLDDRFIFTDDGVSGAEFSEKRPGFQSLMAALFPRPEFQVLIVSEQSRLGRDTIRTLYAIQQIQDAGVKIFSYLDDREITLEEDTDEIQEFIKSWSSSQERRKASQRTRDQKRDKAAQGRLADGRVLGYRTVGDLNSRRREIDPQQADIVRRIFTLCAEGKGLLKIAKALNSEGVTNPTGQVRTGATKAASLWSATGIQAILNRDLYRGVVVYGKTRRVRRAGRKGKIAVPEADWIRVQVPELRIVPQTLWDAAHARLEGARRVYLRKTNGTLDGKPESGLESKYLLSGFLRCGTCGGTLITSNKWGQRGKASLMFACSTRRTRPGACGNKHGVPAAELTEQVLGQLKSYLLDPAFVVTLIVKQLEARRSAPDDLKAERQGLEARIAKLSQELERAAEMVFTGTAPATIREAMLAKEEERRDLQAKLEHLNGLAIEVEQEFNPEAWVKEFKGILDNLRRTFESNARVGRQVLRRLLDGPITVTPGAEGGSFAFFGQASFTKFDPDSGTIRPHNQEVVGRIERRSQEWCPRGDSNTRPAV